MPNASGGDHGWLDCKNFHRFAPEGLQLLIPELGSFVRLPRDPSSLQWVYP